MTRFASLAVWALSTSLWVAVSAAAPAPEVSPALRVLLFSGRNNHDWASTTPEIRRVLEESGRFRVRVTEDPSACTAADFAACDIVLSNWNTFGSAGGETEWPDAMRAALMDAVRGGKGFVVIHAGGTMFPEWDDFQNLIGATWGAGTHHGPVGDFAVDIAEPAHPVMRGLAPFRTRDELWRAMVSRPAKTILARADGEPVAMATRFGGGRGFNLVLGHDVPAMRNAGFRTLLLRGCEWAATGDSTIPPVTGPVLPPTAELAALIEAVSRYVFGADRTAVRTALQMAAESTGSPEPRQVVAALVAARLRTGEGTVDGRARLLDLLGMTGGPNEVPLALASVGDEALGFRAVAALERMDCPEARLALRGLLTGADPVARLHAVGAVGRLRDPEAVAALVTCSGSEDAVLGVAAARALGRIGGTEALAALADPPNGLPPAALRARHAALVECADGLRREGRIAEARSVLRSALEANPRDRVALFPALLTCLNPEEQTAHLDAAFRSPDTDVRRAATRALSGPLPEPVTAALIERLPEFAPDVREALLAAASPRLTAAGFARVREAADVDAGAARREAILHLGRGADPSAPALLARAADRPGEPEADALRAALRTTAVDGADRVFGTLLAELGPQGRVEVVRALRDRGATAELPAVLALLADPEAAVRRSACEAAGVLAGPEACAELLARARLEPGAGERDAACDALLAVCRRAEDVSPLIAGLADSADPARAALLKAVGAFGGETARSCLTEHVRGDAPESARAAARALAAWPDPAPLAALVPVAETTDDEVLRVLALRGAARLAQLPGDLPGAARSDLLLRGLDAAGRPEERVALLDALGAVGDPGALPRLGGLLEDPALGAAAAGAILKTAANPRADREQAKLLVRRILERPPSAEAGERARGVLIELALPPNLARGAVITSPDPWEKDGAAHGDAAAADGDEATYWDEENFKDEYRLHADLGEPAVVGSMRIVGYIHHNYAPRDFSVLCDGRVVKEVAGAVYRDNVLTVVLPETRCRTVELRITGYYGESPAIREWGIHPPLPAGEGAEPGAVRPPQGAGEGRQ